MPDKSFFPFLLSRKNEKKKMKFPYKQQYENQSSSPISFFTVQVFFVIYLISLTNNKTVIEKKYIRDDLTLIYASSE